MTPLSELSAEARRGFREESLLGYAFPLHDTGGAFGPPILPITPWHHLHLVAQGNSVFCGGPRTLAAVLTYLWFCSPAYRPAAPLRAALFRARWRRAVSQRTGLLGLGPRVPTPRILAALEAHAGMITLDRPALPVERDRAPSLAHHDGPHELAALHLTCRRHLGYTTADFWHTPYGHTNQLLALFFACRDPAAPKFDRTRDKAKGEFLRSRTAQRRTAPR